MDKKELLKSCGLREDFDENKTRIDIKNQRRRAKMNLLPNTFSVKDWDNCKKYFNNKSAYCGEELPLTQEHFIPVSEGGEYTINNIIPACQSCNSSKNSRNFFEWYPKQPFYSKQRENRIFKYLNYSKNFSQQLSAF